MNMFDSRTLKGLEIAFSNLKEEVGVDLSQDPESENLNLLNVAIDKAQEAVRNLEGVEKPSYAQIAEFLAYQFFVEYLLDAEDEDFDDEEMEDDCEDDKSCCNHDHHH